MTSLNVINFIGISSSIIPSAWSGTTTSSVIGICSVSLGTITSSSTSSTLSVIGSSSRVCACKISSSFSSLFWNHVLRG